MSEILFQYYRINPTTWVYLSSLMMIALYFQFGRFWSVRNLDLVLLILLAPGLLTAQYGREMSVKAKRLEEMEQAEAAAARSALPEASEDWPAEAADAVADSGVSGSETAEEIEPKPSDAAGDLAVAEGGGAETQAAAKPYSPAKALLDRSLALEGLGFLWLFVVGGIWFIRLLLDPTMVRRPLLEPNLTSGALVFSGVSLFVFLMANVWTSKPPTIESEQTVAVEQLTTELAQVDDSGSVLPRGPGYALLNVIPSIPTAPLVPEGIATSPTEQTYLFAAKVIAILCHLAVVLGIVAIGYWHFGNMKTGVGVATLYLMLPYTAQMTGHIDHVLPAALLVWAVLCYRRPLTSGMLIGLATSLVYYPLFLLPLWVSFYWRRGLMRFSAGVIAMLLLMALSLVFIPHASYWENLKQMFGLWLPQREGLEGIWGLDWNPAYRIPVLAAFVAMSCTLAIWPPQKNLGTLLSCSAAVMVATQFWHGYGGGLYMGWYLPLALLTVFRPNLEDRVALAVLGEGWNSKRVANLAAGIRAA